jgi:hypothetical protein
MSLMTKLQDLVRSLTSDKANTDVPPDTDVPATDAAVPRPDREPMVGFEPEPEPEPERES